MSPDGLNVGGAIAGSQANRDLIAGLIRDVPDFPREGVVFKDITPLIASPRGLAASVEELAATLPSAADIDIVVGMEARGFIFAAPVALRLGAGFVPVRKPGKLPGDVYSETFALEYGEATLNVSRDAFEPGARVAIIDDVLATGGTIIATANLLRQLRAEIVGISVLMDLSFLHDGDLLTRHGLPSARAVVTV